MAGDFVTIAIFHLRPGKIGGLLIHSADIRAKFGIYHGLF